MVSLGDSQFSSVDESVRTIKNWSSSIFVAKSDLEERLKLVEANGNRAFQLQLDQNAGILMNEINEEIKKQVSLSVAAKAKDLEGSKLRVTGGLSEGEVVKIVKGVLAVYDADKTGLVDFALESAGGQVLSTR
jgi:SUN domain-containing protein 1/2